MSTVPLISVIIPAFNYAHYLPETLASLFAQTHSNWECLIVDNNSTDHTKALVLSYSEKDERVKYFCETIKGPSYARNTGLENANGEFIQFLDADDLLQAAKFESAMALFHKFKDADIVYSDMRYFHSEQKEKHYYTMSLDNTADKKWMPYSEGSKADVLPSLLKENIMVISSPIIRRSTLKQIGGFDEQLAYNEDWELWLRFAFENKTFIFDKQDNTRALVRVHSKSHSNNLFKMFTSGLKVEMKYMPLIEDHSLLINFQAKQAYSIYRIEALLFDQRKNTDQLKSDLNELISIYPNKKYNYWLQLINNGKQNRLRQSIALHYYANTFLNKLKLV